MSDQKQMSGADRRGLNVLEDEQRKSVFASFLEQLNSPLIYILMAAAAVPRFFQSTAIWSSFWL